MEVKIIAEVGSNWRNLEDCIKSIHEAKIAGADAVKFQLFTELDLYGMYVLTDATDPKTNIPHNELLRRGSIKCVGTTPLLDPSWLPALKAEADKRGLEFMCTAFSPEGYDLVNPFVKVHKVASSECCHLRILQKLRELGKPVILSTGAKGLEDIRGSLKVLGPTPTTLMYCVVAYPANEVNLDTIKTLRDQFRLPVGYSDHTTDVLCIPRLAVDKGATVIEKHFTIIPEVNTPDQPHSLNPDQFSRMVKSIRGDMAQPVIGPLPSERVALLRYNRRLVVIKDLNPGDELVEGVSFGIYRSLQDDTRAASPFLIDRFIGKRVKVNLKAGDGLWIDDVE